MDKFEYYQLLAAEIQERTNLDWEIMNDVDRVVMKEIYLRLREKFEELIKEYIESLRAINDSLKKIENWEFMNGILQDVDIKNKLN